MSGTRQYTLRDFLCECGHYGRDHSVKAKRCQIAKCPCIFFRYKNAVRGRSGYPPHYFTKDVERDQ